MTLVARYLPVVVLFTGQLSISEFSSHEVFQSGSYWTPRSSRVSGSTSYYLIAPKNPRKFSPLTGVVRFGIVARG